MPTMSLLCTESTKASIDGKACRYRAQDLGCEQIQDQGSGTVLMAMPVSDQSPLVPGQEGAVVVKPGPKASSTQMAKLQLDPRTLNGSRSFKGYSPLAAGGFACSNAPFPSCSHGAHEPRIQHTDLSAAPIRMHMRPSMETRRLL